MLGWSIDFGGTAKINKLYHSYMYVCVGVGVGEHWTHTCLEMYVYG